MLISTCTHHKLSLFGTQDAFTCEELVKSFEPGDAATGWNCLDTIVFIDSTWQQTNQILRVRLHNIVRAGSRGGGFRGCEPPLHISVHR